MKLQELQPAIGSTTAPKRLGRGVGSQLGKTSGKGHKGAKARSGGGKRPGFEGGQMPLTRRIPKRGFTNINRKEYVTVNIGDLNVFEENANVNAKSLMELGLITEERDGIKILGGGTLEKRLFFQVEKVTGSARAQIEAKGGKVEVK